MKFADIVFQGDSIKFFFQRNDRNLRWAVVSLDNFPTVRDAESRDSSFFRINRSGDVVYWPALGFDIDAKILANACT